MNRVLFNAVKNTVVMQCLPNFTPTTSLLKHSLYSTPQSTQPERLGGCCWINYWEAQSHKQERSMGPQCKEQVFWGLC